MWLSSTGGTSKRTKSKRPRYRSARSVQRPHPPVVPRWTLLKAGLFCVGVLVLACAILVPALLLEFASEGDHPVGLHALLHESKSARIEWVEGLLENEEGAFDFAHFLRRRPPVPNVELESPDVHIEKSGVSSDHDTETQDEEQTLARGAAGLPMNQTPALKGARHGTIECDANVHDLAYWNDPQGTRDVEFTSPFASKDEKFLSFEADMGGWNNIRMSMEVIFVLAAATGRTLVLPPKAPFYLLGMGKEGAKTFANFYPISKLKERISIISMADFIKQHGVRLLKTPYIDSLLPVAETCVHRDDDERSCEILHKLLRQRGYQPDMRDSENCLVFDEEYFTTESASDETEQRVRRFCGERKPVYYNRELHDPEWIHWDAGHHEHRLLNHFYSFLFFTDPVIDNYHKRFVRDFLHYTDEIFCAAGKIVHSLREEFDGKFSTLHVRRGDLQFKEVKISAEEWYNNTREVWNPNEALYIATDERNKTWFEPFREHHHQLKFLDDYWDMAGLGKLDKGFLGMIDTIVASHGRAFAGTWFSSFTGYINRLRGYNGKPMKNSWYSFLPRKDRMQKWEYPNGNYPAREWPIGWVGIDGDVVLEHEREIEEPTYVEEETKKAKKKGKKKEEPESANKRHVRVPKLSELADDVGFNKQRALARGVAGLPMSQTPALEGASRAHIECDVNVDSLAYWNDPQGARDVNFKSPFAVMDDAKYISFTADSGGWNNIRMSMEIIFIIAAASGRTLVLPPETNLYLLRADKGKRHRGFADFFPINTAEFQKRVPTITMEEFIHREGGKGGRLPVPEVNRTKVTKAAEHCVNMKKSDRFCDFVSDYLESVAYLPTFQAHDYCVVFDVDVYEDRSISPESEADVNKFCGLKRKVAYWNTDFRDPTLVHFRADQKQFRLLTHFYGMLYFTDPVIGNYFSRFVRDFLHYHDAIYCAAGKIVKALQVEGRKLGFSPDEEGGGGFSAMHIRRGDFQYKKVKLPAEEWYENTKELWKPNEILFIATDERNKTWFDPIFAHHTVRFLDDYWEMAGLGDVDPNYMGMIDTIVASRARAFAGTWFSTFTGYINRMRGYHGMTMQDSWYSFLDRKTAVHTWKNNSDFAYAYEWPTGWIGIDGDSVPSRDKF